MSYNKIDSEVEMFVYKDLNQAFCGSLKEVYRNGQIVNSRGTKQKEVLFHSMTINDPTAISIEVPARKFNSDYAITEWLWYLSMNKHSRNIGKMADIWNQISDPQGKVESNYGSYIFGDQWKWVINELIKDPDSRRGTIVINQPDHKHKNKADYPCTQYIHFFLRNNQLHLGVNMRSNDAVFGFCNDVFTFCMFQQLMLNELNSVSKVKISLGKYYHAAGSFHVYERHFGMMEKVCKNYIPKAETVGYPDLHKFILHDNITYDDFWRCHWVLPSWDMEKDIIKSHTQKVKDLIYD